MSSRIRRASAIFVLTFLISVGLSVVSRTALQYLPLGPSIVLLITIVFLGILFDIIGVAVTAADEGPFHAMATDRVPGARQAVWLIRNADQVASFANDVIGDVAGTVSGAVGASIVFAIVAYRPDLSEVILMTVVVGLVAALTVGGKAYGKGFAIQHCESVVYQVGKLMALIEQALGVTVWHVGKPKRKHRKNRLKAKARKNKGNG